MIRLREEVLEIPAYKQGAIPSSDAVKLSSNENPYPPLPAVVDAVRARIDHVNRYPAMTAPDLVARIAGHHDVAEDMIALGSGSVEVAGQLISATSGPGDEVLFAWPSFTAYPTLTRIAGATPVAVPLTDDDRHDLPAMAAAITERTRMVIVCDPNNPTSTTVGSDQLEQFMAQVPKDVLVVLDVAYVHFNRRADRIDPMAVFHAHPNVALLYTFSKAYGLAGLRVGYAVARPEIADALRRVAIPFGVTDLAQQAAITSLDAQDQLDERIQAILTERTRVLAALREAGCEVADSEANFVWVRTGERTAQVNETLTAHGVLARASGTGVRITVGTPAENDRVVDAATDLARVLAS